MQPGMEAGDRRVRALGYRGRGMCMLGSGTPSLGASSLLATLVPLGGGGRCPPWEQGPAETCWEWMGANSSGLSFPLQSQSLN